MGEFRAGTWLIGLFLYFFLFTVIVYAGVEASRDYGLDTSNYQTYGQNYMQVDTENECSGIVSPYCGAMLGADVNESCEYIAGCDYSFVSGANLFFCGGTHNITDCSTVTDVDTCLILGCTYTGNDVPTKVDPNNEYDYSVVKETFDTMFGFNAFFGLPEQISWIFRILFIVIPMLILTWALYMAIPFIH